MDKWTPTNGGVYFWDNKSWDGTNCNVGFVLTGQAGTAGNRCNNVVPSGILPLKSPPGNIPFWAKADGKSAVSEFWFSPTGSQHSVQLEVEIAGYAPNNQLWVYFTSNPSVGLLLFNGAASAPKTASFTANGDFGFYVVANGNSTAKYYTQSSLNGNGDNGYQHFALFRESPKGTAGLNVDDYWLGVEDLPLRPTVNNDRDYQDMLFRVHTVPEPTSLFQLCTYLLCFAMVFGITRLRKSRG